MSRAYERNEPRCPQGHARAEHGYFYRGKYSHCATCQRDRKRAARIASDYPPGDTMSKKTELTRRVEALEKHIDGLEEHVRKEFAKGAEKVDQPMADVLAGYVSGVIGRSIAGRVDSAPEPAPVKVRVILKSGATEVGFVRSSVGFGLCIGPIDSHALQFSLPWADIAAVVPYPPEPKPTADGGVRY